MPWGQDYEIIGPYNTSPRTSKKGHVHQSRPVLSKGSCASLPAIFVNFLTVHSQFLESPQSTPSFPSPYTLAMLPLTPPPSSSSRGPLDISMSRFNLPQHMIVVFMIHLALPPIRGQQPCARLPGLRVALSKCVSLSLPGPPAVH